MKHLPPAATTPLLGVGRLIANLSFSDLPPRYRDDAAAKEMAGLVDKGEPR